MDAAETKRQILRTLTFTGPPLPHHLPFATAAYTSDEYGFSIDYPADWTMANVRSVDSFRALRTKGYGLGLYVRVTDVVEGESFTDYLERLSKKGSSRVTQISEIATTTQDGTPAIIVERTLLQFGQFLTQHTVIGVDKEGKRIAIAIVVPLAIKLPVMDPWISVPDKTPDRSTAIFATAVTGEEYELYGEDMTRERVEAARALVKTYRIAHGELHNQAQRGKPPDHEVILETLQSGLSALGMSLEEEGKLTTLVHWTDNWINAHPD